MRKSLVVLVLLGALGVLGSTAPAHAQTTGLRDPFDPLLSAETDDGTTTTGAPTDTGTDVDDPTTTGDPVAFTDDELPTTGTDATNWLAAAYVLVALGAGLVAVARLLRPEGRRIEARG